MSIVTSKEVINNSPSIKELTARPEPVCDVLEHTEQQYLIKLFGETVYQELLDTRIDLSSATVWDDETDYVEDDIVLYEGEYYQLNVAESTSSDTPNCNTEWIRVEKFTKACFNQMFSTSGGGLLKLLSWVIFAAALPFYPNILGVTDFIGTDKEYKEKINYKLSGIYSNIAKM